jgi:hypothetical protein
MGGRADSGRTHQASAPLAELAAGTKPMRGTAELCRRAIELRARASKAIARARVLHQQTSGLIYESRRLRRIPRIPVGTPMSAPQSSRRPDAVTQRCHLAWHLVAMLIILTGQLAPKRPRPLWCRRLHGNGTDQARVEQTVHRMTASARRSPRSRRTPGALQGLRCSLVPVCRSTPPTHIPTARQADAMQSTGVASWPSRSFGAPVQISASVLQAGVVRSAP